MELSGLLYMSPILCLGKKMFSELLEQGLFGTQNRTGYFGDNRKPLLRNKNQQDALFTLHLFEN
jgi:hypothetical protein